MPELKYEICHSTERVFQEYKQGEPFGVLCGPCSDALVQLGNTIDSLRRAAKYLDGEDINV